MALTAAHIANYQLPKLENMDAGDQYDTLQTIISDAQQQEVFPPAPHNEGQNIMHESRITVVRTRLFLLGYLSEDDQSTTWDNALKEGMQEFQEDSGLSITGQIDRESWIALQEMVSFEHEIEVEKWYHNGVPLPSMLRAIGLRLYVFGLLDKKMSPQGRKQKKQEKLEDKRKQKKQAKLQDQMAKAIQEGLNEFAELSFFLGLADQSLPRIDSSIFPSNTVRALFDQDRILEGISKAWNGQAFSLNRLPDFKPTQTRERVKNFIVCCARVELWLHGYDVSLDGQPQYKVPIDTSRSIKAVSFPMFHALNSFWEDSGLGEDDAWRKAKTIEGDFFQMVSKMQADGAKAKILQPSEEVYKVIIHEEPTVISKIWDGIRTIGSRIWDGIKRAWNWFKALMGKIGKAIKKVASWAKNLSRLAYRYAMNAFPAVHQIIQSVSASVKALIHPVFPDSDPKVMMIKRDKDFDFSVFVNEDSTPEQQVALLQKFQYNAVLVRFGFEIMRLLIGTIIDLVKKIVTAGGWFGLILALLKAFSRLKELQVVLADESVLLSKI